MTLPRKGSRFIDAVGWILTAFGLLGSVIAAIQFFFMLAGGVAGTIRAVYLVIPAFAFGYSLLLLWIGNGLRRRRAEARVALVVLLTIGVLWNVYWLAAYALSQPLPPFSRAEVSDSELRTPMIMTSLFVTGLYVWILLKLRQPRIKAEFQP